MQSFIFDFTPMLVSENCIQQVRFIGVSGCTMLNSQTTIPSSVFLANFQTWPQTVSFIILWMNKKNLDGQFMGCLGFLLSHMYPGVTVGWPNSSAAASPSSQAGEFYRDSKEDGDFCLVPKRWAGWWFQIFVIFIPILGEMIQFDEHIFQLGWNHQLVGIFENPKWPWDCQHQSGWCLGYPGDPRYPLMKVGEVEVFFPRNLPLKVGTRHICPIKIWKESKTIKKTKLKKLKCETNTFGGCWNVSILGMIWHDEYTSDVRGILVASRLCRKLLLTAWQC